MARNGSAAYHDQSVEIGQPKLLSERARGEPTQILDPIYAASGSVLGTSSWSLVPIRFTATGVGFASEHILETPMVRDFGGVRQVKMEWKGRITGPVKATSALLSVWNLDEKQGALLLDYESEAELRELLSGVTSLKGHDRLARIAHLLAIRTYLDHLFRDEAVEREWIREPRKELEGQSPLMFMMEGSLERIAYVRQFVEQVSGR